MVAPWHLCDRGSGFHITVSPVAPFSSKGSIPAVGSWDLKGDKRITCRRGCVCGGLSCWGQQVGFLPSRDDAFYNEEVKKIIMEINSWSAMACELSQAELWMWRAELQCRAEQENLIFTVSWGWAEQYSDNPQSSLTRVLCVCVCVCVCVSVYAGVWLHAYEHSCHLTHTDVLLTN